MTRLTTPALKAAWWNGFCWAFAIAFVGFTVGSILGGGK